MHRRCEGGWEEIYVQKGEPFQVVGKLLGDRTILNIYAFVIVVIIIIILKVGPLNGIMVLPL